MKPGAGLLFFNSVAAYLQHYSLCLASAFTPYLSQPLCKRETCISIPKEIYNFSVGQTNPEILP